MNLTHDAMLVSLRISAWSGRQYDRKASNHVAVHHEASASAGRYNKCLLPKAAFAALTATMSKARSSHYEQTLPWDDQGSRLLTVASLGQVSPAYSAVDWHAVRRLRRWLCLKHKVKTGKYVRFPDTRLRDEYGLTRLSPRTKGLLHAKA